MITDDQLWAIIDGFTPDAELDRPSYGEDDLLEPSHTRHQAQIFDSITWHSYYYIDQHGTEVFHSHTTHLHRN